MDAIADLLTRFPSCRVTIRSGPVRRKPYEGELRVLARKGRQIRVRRRATGYGGHFIGYMVRGSRPLYDWVSEADLTPADRDTYRRTRENRGDPL